MMEQQQLTGLIFQPSANIVSGQTLSATGSGTVHLKMLEPVKL